MVGVGLLLIIVALIFGGFYFWARRQGLLATEPPAEEVQGNRRISLLTEAVAYVGAILLLAGGIATLGQRWDSIGVWGRVGVFAGAAAFFLAVGIVLRRVREPAIQRLVGVVWFLSVACVAGAVGYATLDEHQNLTDATILAVGVATTVYSAALWLLRQRGLQNVALFAGLVTAICGIIVTAAGGRGSAPSLAFALVLWGFGLAWAWLGWRRYVEPAWVTIPCGAILALIAPIFAVTDHGWVYAIGIATAAAAMAASVPRQNTPLLALGTLAMFGYVTAVVVRYFHESLGVPGALTVTGVLILLAVVSARLMRGVRPPKHKEPGAKEPSDKDLPKAA
jgi:hypothetical protein